MPISSLALQARPLLAARPAAVLSPRQQQALRLLQWPSDEFGQWLRQAALANPFLEWDEPPPEPAPAPEADPMGVAPDDPSGAGAEEPEAPWETGFEGPTGGTRGLETLAEPLRLADHLCRQIGLLRLAPRERLLAEALALSLDDDGYLRDDVHDIAAALGLTPPPAPDEWSLALRRVQSLEPAGVGARSLSECLALQLTASAHRRAGWPEADALALRIVREHLPGLARGDLSALAARLGEPLPEVVAACARIRRLAPRPCQQLEARGAPIQIPDVVVRQRQGRWEAHLNPAILPRLRLQPAVADWQRRHHRQSGPVWGSLLQEARWMLRNVEQRFATILAVARAILARQHRFLAHGPLALRPLGLREIAQAVGAHESTVSRATRQKFMATPCGLFELKFFFSRGLPADGGGACSPTAVRGLIRELVAAEPPGAPLSDVALARALAAYGVRVARRTVTLYRQQLRIEPAPRRLRRPPGDNSAIG